MPFALRNTYAHFKRNPWCGGLTGELRVERPYRNFLTSVQYMEWKVRGRVHNQGWAGRPEGSGSLASPGCSSPGVGFDGGACWSATVAHALPMGGIA